MLYLMAIPVSHYSPTDFCDEIYHHLLYWAVFPCPTHSQIQRSDLWHMIVHVDQDKNK